jgi:hypothetical protein
MKDKMNLRYALAPFVIALCLYIVFYERIASKPTSAGFWLILVLGMSIGVAIMRIILFQKKQ